MNRDEEKKIRLLAGMLDDADDFIAVEVMAELLSYGDAIGDVLAELQDSGKPAVRKRVQQLESILVLRKRRRDFLKLLEKSDLMLAEGLREVHLLWFDNDNVVSLQKSYDKFFAGMEKYSCLKLSDAVYVLNKTSMRIEKETTQEPELYCIGTVIDDRRAAPSMAAALIGELGRRRGRDWKIVNLRGEFGVYSPAEKTILLMKRDCRTDEMTEPKSFSVVSERQILRYFGSMLFSHAVLSDNFRYIHTIGQSLSGGNDGEYLDFLPYPYLPAPDDADGEEEYRDGEDDGGTEHSGAEHD